MHLIGRIIIQNKYVFEFKSIFILVYLKINLLVKMPPWRNKYLLYAIALSMSLHMMILYIPMFNVSLIFHFV